MPMIIRNNIRYAGGSGGSNGSGENIVELTQAEYDALGDVVNSDNITYYITDADEQLDASGVAFDDTETQLGASDVQGAIKKVATDISELNSNLGGIEFSTDADGKGQYRVLGASEWTPFLSGGVDISDTTVSPADVTVGLIFYDKDGNRCVGERPAPVGYQSGSFSMFVNTGATASYSLTFPEPFESVPSVTASHNQDKKYTSWAGNITTTGCTIYVSSQSSVGRQVVVTWKAYA